MITPSDYEQLFSSCILTTDPRQVQELNYVCRVAIANELAYQTVSAATGIPWPAIAVIHFREAGQNFKSHLHNGDPLTARTTHVPAGRPARGEPPFTWSVSAIDALSGLWRPREWSIPMCLSFFASYNGFGYEKRGVLSPYLWDFTDKYSSGLFVADGHFDPNAKESRPGAVAILKTLQARGVAIG